MEMVASIAGLLAAVFQISSELQQFISAVNNAPSLSRAICFEMHDFRFVLLKLDPIIRGLATLNISGACLADIDHLSVTLAGCVLALSELEREVKKLKLSGKLDIWDRMKWTWAEPELTLITQRLQNQKLSLVLILTILTSESSAEVIESQQTLHENSQPPIYSSAIGSMTLIDDKSTRLTHDTRNTTRPKSPISWISLSQLEPPAFQDRHKRTSNSPDSPFATLQRPKRRWSMLSGVSRHSIVSPQSPTHTPPGIRREAVPDRNPTPIPVSTERSASPHMRRFKSIEELNQSEKAPQAESTQRAANDLMHQYALHFAAEEGLIEEVRWLLAHERDVDEENDDSETPLQLAVRGGHMHIVRLLLDHGAKTAVIFSNGTTILHLAAELGNKVIVQMLLDSGAEAEARTILGDTPLQCAAIMGRAAIVRLMLDRGVEDTRENEGATPLHHAACVGQEEIAGLLLNRGANADSVGEDGNTPLHFAVMGGYQEVVDSLLEHGADPGPRNRYHRSMDGYCAGGQIPLRTGIRKTQSIGTYWGS